MSLKDTTYPDLSVCLSNVWLDISSHPKYYILVNLALFYVQQKHTFPIIQTRVVCQTFIRLSKMPVFSITIRFGLCNFCNDLVDKSNYLLDG